MLGAQLGPYLEPSEWQLGAQFRTSRADKQYQGTRLSPEVTRLGTNVISKLQILDITGTYAVDRQWNLTLNVPIQIYGSSSRALPGTVAGSPRFVQTARGLGDLSLVARRWIFKCETHPHENISLGVGVKFPTGNSNSMDTFPNGRGQDIRLRSLDPSIQLGDGGWGVILDFQGFKQMGTLTVFGSASYLMNPRDQTGTLSPPAFLNPNGPGAVPAEFRHLTVADQYSARVGVTHPVPGVKGLAVVLAARIDGVPTEDLFGDTVGFRRAGYLIAVEPGLIYSTGRTTFSLTVPVTTQQNILPQNGLPRDSTFPDVQIIASVTHRFGR